MLQDSTPPRSTARMVPIAILVRTPSADTKAADLKWGHNCSMSVIYTLRRLSPLLGRHYFNNSSPCRAKPETEWRS